MAKLTSREILDAVKEMSVLEVHELVELMKEELGVDPSAVTVSAQPKAEEVVEEAGTKTVVLKEAGATKLQVIKIVRDVTGLGLKEAKDIVDQGGNVKENIPTDEANELKTKLEEAGATVELI